jgi:hypothetical protein
MRLGLPTKTNPNREFENKMSIRAESAKGKRRTSAQCDVCGHPAAAHWRGHHGIAICGACAIEVLPSLLADAIDLPLPRMAGAAKLALMQAECRYWRALAMRMMRGAK